MMFNIFFRKKARFDVFLVFPSSCYYEDVGSWSSFDVVEIMNMSQSVILLSSQKLFVQWRHLIPALNA